MKNEEFEDSAKNSDKKKKIISSKDKNIEEREKLLDTFLSEIATSNNNITDDYKHTESFLDFTIDDYPEIEIPDEIEIKIKKLREIAASIENKKETISISPQKADKKYTIDYARSLNTEQLLAVTTINGPLLIIAGAGSGKTRVIVYRVSYLLENDINPQEILLLTFTRKAAKEMLSRVEKLLKDKNVGKITGGTFHSFASFILRKYSNLLNIPNNFTIIDTIDAEDTIDLIRTELKYNKKAIKFPRKRRIQSIISSARNRNITIRQVIEKEFSGLLDYVEDIELICNGYTKYKKMSNIFDFDDLMEVLRNSLRDNLHFREKLQEVYRYIMVDEFQDTNLAQKEIVDYIAERHKNIMVVGDDSQSIYAFRGANFENILRFPETYPECQVTKIEQNYRSNQKILDFTNSIIEHAKMGYKKTLYSKIFNDNTPFIKKFYDQEEEAAFIVSKIIELNEKEIPLNQIAVLNRADWHNRYIQAELTRRSIPYVVVGGFRFNERRHIKDVISFLRIVFNPLDAVAWNRILKLLPGIGKMSAGNIIRELRKHKGIINFKHFADKNYCDELKRLEQILKKAGNTSVSIAGKLKIIKEYYSPILETKEIDYKIRLLDINVLIDLAGKYTDIEKFLSDFALEPPSKNLAGHTTPLIDETEDKPLVVSTVHSAKGLEWYAVFIPHALEGLFPSNRAINIEEMEEERRLFYVACTRAKEKLFITFPSNIISYDAYFSYPSRFIVEIEKDKYQV